MPTVPIPPRDDSWTLDGLTYSGRLWGPPDGLPVLALHGWMDHADSFAALAPRLDGCRVVALDLSGQGHSDHRAAHATYNIWDDLPQIDALLDRLGWDSAVLLGHSRGANISALYAAARPERVRALVSLDSLVPEPSDDDVVRTLSAFIDQTRKALTRPQRRFPTRADYVDRRCAQGNSRQTSEALADRALRITGAEVRMRADNRLFASSAVKLTRAQVEHVLRAIRCPVLNIWAAEGILARRPTAAELAELGQALVRDYERIEMPGDHHFHLDPGVVGPMAGAILGFLDRQGLRGG